MLNLIFNENVIIVGVLVFIFILLIQYFQDKNINNIYKSIGLIISLIVFIYYKDNILIYFNIGLNENTSVIENTSKYDIWMRILNSNYLLHIVVLYLIFILLILLGYNKVIENNLELIYIKNILGEKVQKYLLYYIKFTGKSNKIFIGLISITIIISLLGIIYIEYNILNNIELISEIIQNHKNK
jgi:hypothetical protein